MSTSRMNVLRLYKRIQREGQKLTDYNFRQYALQRSRDAFKTNKSEADPKRIEELIKKAEENLGIIQRQAIISQLYQPPSPLVVEEKSPTDEDKKT